jgi:hypothetical protein
MAEEIKVKKFNCIIKNVDGTEEAKLFEAKSKSALKKKFRDEKIPVKSIREQFSIKAGLIFFITFCIFIAPAAIAFDTAFMSTNVLFFIGLCWVISLLTRNPSKAIFPAAITLMLLLWLLAINMNFSRGMIRMVPEGNTIVQGLEDYRQIYGTYPKALDQLVPQFLEEVPDKPFRYSYFYRPNNTYGLVTNIPPFNVVYDETIKMWRPHYPT